MRVHSADPKKIQLFKLLDSSRRLRLVAPEEVDHRLCAGLFSVVKSAQKDRLILDARARNCLEQPVERSWASGEVLVPEGRVLKCSTNDLRDFYNNFEVSERRSRRNILCGPVKTSDVRVARCYTRAAPKALRGSEYSSHGRPPSSGHCSDLPPRVGRSE